MSPTDDLIVCPVCGTQYSAAEGRVCRVDCPLHRTCRLLSCPYCAHEVPAPTRLTRWLSRWLSRRDRPAPTDALHKQESGVIAPHGEGDGDRTGR